MDPNLLWFPLMGVIAGFLAGLLGIGGGIVLVAALVFLLPHFQVPDSAITHVALASSLASIVITGASSAYAHHRRGGGFDKELWLVGAGITHRCQSGWGSCGGAELHGFTVGRCRLLHHRRGAHGRGYE